MALGLACCSETKKWVLLGLVLRKAVAKGPMAVLMALAAELLSQLPLPLLPLLLLLSQKPPPLLLLLFQKLLLMVLVLALLAREVDGEHSP